MKSIVVWASMLLILAGCASTQTAGILLLGDSGYDLEYGSWSPDEPKTLTQFRQDYIDYLTRTGSPDPESEIPPHAVLPDSGHTVMASGQWAVADAVEHYCESGASCDFGLLLGDNIYPDGATEGTDGHTDADRFQDILVAPYKKIFSQRPEFQFDVTLGNHDWHTSLGGAVAQQRFMDAHPDYFMQDMFYVRRHETSAGTVDVFAIDTELLLSTVAVPKLRMTDDGDMEFREEVQTPSQWLREYAMSRPDQVEWLRSQLRASDARWKIVFGHHPLWSSAGWKIGQARELRRLLLPVLCPLADMYVAGHDHTLELHEQNCDDYPDSSSLPLPHVVSGAAGKQRPVNHIFMNRQAETTPGFTSFWAQGMVWGFAHLALEDDDATVTIISTPDDASGAAIVEYERRFRRRSGYQRQPPLPLPVMDQ